MYRCVHIIIMELTATKTARAKFPQVKLLFNNDQKWRCYFQAISGKMLISSLSKLFVTSMSVKNISGTIGEIGPSKYLLVEVVNFPCTNKVICV